MVSVAFAQKTFEGTISYSYKMTGENADQMQAFIPEGMDLTVSKKGMIVEMKGGMMQAMMGKILTTKKGAFMIKDSEQTIYEMDISEEETKDAAPESVEKQDETEQIMGYTCQKYKTVSSNGDLGKQVTYIWATEEFEFPEIKNVKGVQSVDVKGVPGVALKTMSTVMGVTVILEAVEINEEKPDKNLFKLPKSYDRKKFDPEAMGAGMWKI